MIRRVMVAGGGTGGHLFPGLAVVEELRRRIPALEVKFVGTRRGIEARILPELGEDLELIEVAPLKGKGWRDVVRGVGALPRAATSSGRVLRSFSPDLVLGVGGYASGPVLAAAAAFRIRTAVLEQNASVGLTNRLLAPFVGRAYVSFAESVARFPKDRVRLSGNPVRREFVDAARRAMTDPAGFEAKAENILVLGGSQGSHALNEQVPAMLAQAGVARRGIRVVHQTGEAMRDSVSARYRDLGVDALVVPFIREMAAAYESALFVVSRAGATTVAELCALGRPSVLIPFPHAADDHQTRNAIALERAHAALCIPQSTLGDGRAVSEIAALMADQGRRTRMADAARKLGRPDAAASIVDDLLAWDAAVTPGSLGDSASGTTASSGGVAPKTSLASQRPYIPGGMSWSQRGRSSVPPHRRPIVDTLDSVD